MSPTDQRLLREFIHIPERTSDSDFMHSLIDGVANITSTLRNFVVTESLVGNFDQALGLVASAAESGMSKAAYLHGSFGSGKSHFMAVLHALLGRAPAVGALDELAEVVAKYDPVFGGRKLLLVPFHMLGATSLEQGVLGGYANYVRTHHPQVPVPAVHRTDTIEDEADFVPLDRGLTEIAAHAKGLGYDVLVLFLDELILWLANFKENQAFVSREIQKITNFVEGGDTRRAVPIVSFIARQCDLRELVGANLAGDARLGVINTFELAAAQFATITIEDRNLPRIAHERLLTPVDAQAAEAIAKVFESTTRVHGEVREVWDALLGDEGSVGGDGSVGDAAGAFRLSYPFNPAFMDTLVHVSSALQRSRTALKLMRQLLVERRDDILLGEVVPIGDLYDVITRGDQTFTNKIKSEFEAAQKLYETKLRPFLLEQNRVSENDVARFRRGWGRAPASGGGVSDAGARPMSAQAVARVRAFTSDDRLMKTLLLAALAPSVPALRNLSVRRLSALNHDSIISPIPGQASTRVARKVQTWAAEFGEINVTPGDDPEVILDLAGVDVDSVLATAGYYDTPDARTLLVQRLLWEELGIGLAGSFASTSFASTSFAARRELLWRGSSRSVEVFLGKVRELSDETFAPLDPASWRVVIDYPFDEGSYGSAAGRARVDNLVEAGAHERTVCWLPAHFTVERLGDLRHLVVLEALLCGQRFDSHARHLSASDRQRARATLVHRRDALLTRMRGVLRQAYGLAGKHPEDVDMAFGDHLMTLRPPLRPTLPVGASMSDALRRLAEDMLAEQYPAHPDFDPDRTGRKVRVDEVKTVFRYVRAAAEAGDGRVEVDTADQAVLRRIANPLELGVMHESVFVVGNTWVYHFLRSAAQARLPSDEIRVAHLLNWINQPVPRGLEPDVARLVVACFAEQTDRAWVRHDTTLDPPPEVSSIATDTMLREQWLPDECTWLRAHDRAERIWGLKQPRLRRGRVVGEFVAAVSRRASADVGPARDLVEALGLYAQPLGLDPSATTGRLATARRALDLLETLEALDNPRSGNDLVAMLADADLDGCAEHLALSISSARHVSQALAAAPWDIVDMLTGLGEPLQERAEDVASALRNAARADELSQSLPDALAEAGQAAAALVREALKRKDAPMDVPEARPKVLPEVLTKHSEGHPPPPSDPLPDHWGVTPPSDRDDWDTSVLDRGSTWYRDNVRHGVRDSLRDHAEPRRLANAASGARRQWKVGAADLERAVAELRDAVGDTPGEIEINWWPAR